MRGLLHRCDLGVQPADVCLRHSLRSLRSRTSPGRPLLPSTVCTAEKTPKKRTSRGKAGSAVERLQNNPAYQRLRKTAWKDVYKPAEDAQPSGTVPAHILEGATRQPLAASEAPSNPYQAQDVRPSAAEDSHREGQSAQASTSGRPLATSPGRSSKSGQMATAGDTGKLQQQGRQQQPGYLEFGGQVQRSVRTSRVRFWLNFHTDFGQRIRLVGSNENMGNWVLAQGAELQWSTGDMWNTIVELPAGAVIEYKYVLLDNSGQAVAWQRGNNSVLAVGHSDDDVEVYDNWEGSPGASVVAAGETTTREGRLLSWANEIEALFASQRGELRKSRMELVKAQDDARLAREEARKFKAELRASEAERRKAELKVKELDVANRLLRTQLSETTLSFRNAMETTQQFLLEAERSMSRRETEQPGAVTSAAMSMSTPLLEPADSSAPSASGVSGSSDAFTTGSPVEASGGNGVAGGMVETSVNGTSAFSTETTSTTSSNNGVVSRSAKLTKKAPVQNGAPKKRRKAAASNGRTVKAAAIPHDSSGTDGLAYEVQAPSEEQVGEPEKSEAMPDERKLAGIISL